MVFSHPRTSKTKVTKVTLGVEKSVPHPEPWTLGQSFVFISNTRVFWLRKVEENVSSILKLRLVLILLKLWLYWLVSLFLQFLFDAFISLIKKGKDANIVSVMPKKPYIPPRAQVHYVTQFQQVYLLMNSSWFQVCSTWSKSRTLNHSLRV